MERSDRFRQIDQLRKQHRVVSMRTILDRIGFDSIYRFKGQEAGAVILVDINPRTDRREHEQRLLFCGMTRATVRLELLVNQHNPEAKVFLEQWCLRRYGFAVYLRHAHAHRISPVHKTLARLLV